jgi:CheY-like chemotaxis protein/GAF domain-containing protein
LTESNALGSGIVLTDRPRILILQSPGRADANLPPGWPPSCDLVAVDSVQLALTRLRSEHFDAFLAAPSDLTVAQSANSLLQAEGVLETMADGLAVLDADRKIRWANPAFAAWCDGLAVDRNVFEALGAPSPNPEPCPLRPALSGKKTVTRLPVRGNRTLELHLTPVARPDGLFSQLIALGRDVTAEVQQQQKLDALHLAGRELAALSPDQLNDMSIGERVELLKMNIRRFTHDLLHYDVVEIRLLDRQTGRLEPLLEEGMTPQAAQRVLYPQPTGNGVTGLVAATGKSYLCTDTADDPHYILGAAGAHSSLTVPLIYQEQVIGTFNVESPRTNAFGEDDLQFTEIFSREVANALHTLELLSAEKLSTATQSIDAISREVAMPVDDILGAATAVLDRYIGHEPEMAAKLRQILAAARSIKQCIQRVGKDLAPASATGATGESAHPRLKGMRVLVADNDERVRRSAHNILGRWGCVIETARDGQEALTMAKLSSYDAILADIRLPDLCGYDAYRKFREAQPKARVILMTAYGYDPSHTIVKARQDGLRLVLYKPFRVDQLMDTLESPEPPSSPSTPAPSRPVRA